MTILAIVVALIIGGAVCMLVGYAIGATRGEYDGARRERLMAGAPRPWTLGPACPGCGGEMMRSLRSWDCFTCHTSVPEEASE